MRALFQITEKGRAADGRRLAARATLVQLAIFWCLFAFLGMTEIAAGKGFTTHLRSLVMTSAFYLFVVYALARGWVVVGVLFGLYALLGILLASNLIGTHPLYAMGAIVTSILNFVALCGIVIWLRNRRSNQRQVT